MAVSQRAEYTANRCFSKLNFRRLVHAGAATTLFAGLIGLTSMTVPSATATPLVASGPIAVPYSDPVWLEHCREIFRLLFGDLALFDTIATSPAAAMQLLIAQYEEGVQYPRDTASIEALKQNLSDAACMLRDAPSTVDPELVRDTLKVLTAEWIDVGGYPGDLGC